MEHQGANKEMKCSATKVEPKQNSLVYMDNELDREEPYRHSGVITHVCMFFITEELPHPEYCICKCGHQWRKIG